MPGTCGWGGEELGDACALRDSEMQEGQTHAWATGRPAGTWHGRKEGLEARGAVLPAAWKLVQLAAAWRGVAPRRLPPGHQGQRRTPL